MSRRAALRWLASGATGAVVVGPAEHAIAAEMVKELPYARMPEGVLPGTVQRYATALPLAGYARGVIAASYEGRPIKVDGNPRHAVSLGAADIFAQAEVLSLYDPDRSQAIRVAGEISNWPAFEAALRGQMARHAEDRGAGLRPIERAHHLTDSARPDRRAARRLSGDALACLRAVRRRRDCSDAPSVRTPVASSAPVR